MFEPNEAVVAAGADGWQALHHQLLRRAVSHFFPGATLTISGPASARLQRAPAAARQVQFACAGSQSECSPDQPFSLSAQHPPHTRRLKTSLGLAFHSDTAH